MISWGELNRFIQFQPVLWYSILQLMKLFFSRPQPTCEQRFPRYNPRASAWKMAGQFHFLNGNNRFAITIIAYSGVYSFYQTTSTSKLEATSTNLCWRAPWLIQCGSFCNVISSPSTDACYVYGWHTLFGLQVVAVLLTTTHRPPFTKLCSFNLRPPPNTADTRAHPIHCHRVACWI